MVNKPLIKPIEDAFLLNMVIVHCHVGIRGVYLYLFENPSPELAPCCGIPLKFCITIVQRVAC